MRWFIITVTVIALQSAAARAQFLGKSVAQWAMELEKGDDAAKRGGWHRQKLGFR